MLDKECLALVPMLDHPKQRSITHIPTRSAMSIIKARRAELSATQADAIGESTISVAPKFVKAVLDEPMSAYAEAIRSIKMTIDESETDDLSKVVGFVSCSPAEGKSTLALATAAQIAQSGARVIVVDCDVRNPSLSRTLTPEASVGVLDVIAGTASLDDAIWSYPSGKMAFLPRGTKVKTANAADLMSSEAAKKLFSSLQLRYDYVIVDLAPLVSYLDIRATSHLVQSYMLVIEWGATKADELQYALRNTPGVKERIAGAVLNKVNLTRLERYDHYGARYYYGQGHNTLQ